MTAQRPYQPPPRPLRTPRLPGRYDAREHATRPELIPDFREPPEPDEALDEETGEQP